MATPMQDKAEPATSDPAPLTFDPPRHAAHAGEAPGDPLTIDSRVIDLIDPIGPGFPDVESVARSGIGKAPPERIPDFVKAPNPTKDQGFDERHREKVEPAPE